MTTEGVDYVAPGVTPAELRAAGKTFVLRYLDRNGHDYPSLTAAEAAAFHAAGIDVGLIAEWGATRMLGGAAAGAVDGKRAHDILAALGAPAGTVVWFCADWDAQNISFPAIDAYLNAASPFIGKDATGLYAGGRVLAHVHASGSASHFWQCASTSWGSLQPFIHLHQYLNGQTVAGHGVDLDRAMVAQWGQWPAVAPKPAPAPAPKPVPAPAPKPVVYTLHVAAKAQVQVVPVNAAKPPQITGNPVVTTWGPKASSAPCSMPQTLRGTHSGQASCVYVPRGAFAGKWVHAVSPGVSVTHS